MQAAMRNMLLAEGWLHIPPGGKNLNEKRALCAAYILSLPPSSVDVDSVLPAVGSDALTYLCQSAPVGWRFVF